MNVTQLARQAGVAPSAVRWYEATGVLPPARRRANGYRDYGEPDLARLRLLVALRRLGLPPDDAGRLARSCLESPGVDPDLSALLDRQRLAIAGRRAELDRLDAELTDLQDTLAAAARSSRSSVSSARSSRSSVSTARSHRLASSKESAMLDRPIRVLFVCTGNSARSQMAEALLAAHGGADFEVLSAGTEPKGVNPYTVRALAEAGIDWTRARSKSVNEFLGQPFDYVITVCDRARQVCPVFPGDHNSLHWGLEDPAEVEGSDDERLAAFRRTRQELLVRLRPFIELARRARREATPA